MSEQGQIGRTIFHQIGGTRLIAMTGAKDFVCTPNGLRFRIPNRKINMVEITLTPADDYTIQYCLFRGTVVRLVAQENGIYCDQLLESFERNTGLRTHL